MAFTPDELQSFNDIFERRFATHRRDIEQLFDQHMHALRQDFERRLISNRQETVRLLEQQLHEHEKSWQIILQRKLSEQQFALTREMNRERVSYSHEQLPAAEGIDQALAAQLLAIEELLRRQSPQPPQEGELDVFTGEEPPYEAFEVQTDLPWDELVDIFGKILDERLSVFTEATLNALRNWEQTVSSRLHAIQVQVHEMAAQGRQAQGESPASMHEVFQSIEQLERLIESMQVAMTTNQALLANRLYHHQLLPLERAHAGNQAAPPTLASPNGTASVRSRPGERDTAGDS